MAYSIMSTLLAKILFSGSLAVQHSKQAAYSLCLSLPLSNSHTLSLADTWHPREAWLALHDTTSFFFLSFFLVPRFSMQLFSQGKQAGRWVLGFGFGVACLLVFLLGSPFLRCFS